MINPHKQTNGAFVWRGYKRLTSEHMRGKYLKTFFSLRLTKNDPIMKTIALKYHNHRKLYIAEEQSLILISESIAVSPHN